MVPCLQDPVADVRGEAAKSLCELSAQANEIECLNPGKIANLVSPLLSQDQQHQHVLDDAVEGLALLGDVAAHVVLPYLITGQTSERQAAVEVLRKVGEALALDKHIHHEDSKLL